MIKKFKNLFNKKYISVDKVHEQIQKAVEKERDILKKEHGEEVSSIIDDMYQDKTIEIKDLQQEIKKVEKENEKLIKRNEYLEKEYFNMCEHSKINSIVSQEMSTDAKRLEELIVRATGLIHGINNKAQLHHKKVQKDRMKYNDKLRKLET